MPEKKLASAPAPTPSTFEIRTAKEQKAYFHPVRMKILGLLALEKLTVSQVAARFGVHPANITHQFRVLERAGLIRLAERRDIGRNVEKYYAAAATSFDIRPEPGTVKHVGAKALAFLRDDLTANIHRLRADDRDELTALIMRARIGGSTFKVFAKKLRALIQEFEGLDEAETDAGARPYALNLSLYPHRAEWGPIGRYELKKKKRLEAVE